MFKTWTHLIGSSLFLSLSPHNSDWLTAVYQRSVVLLWCLLWSPILTIWSFWTWVKTVCRIQELNRCVFSLESPHCRLETLKSVYFLDFTILTHTIYEYTQHPSLHFLLVIILCFYLLSQNTFENVSQKYSFGFWKFHCSFTM